MTDCPPVLLIVFNRPDRARELLDVVRNVAPSRLYIACDGARSERPEEAKAVSECRSIADDVDWDCTVERLFHETNKGSASAIPAAVDWFFENEPAGIVLEDDCSPHVDFFRFCSELLERYAQNPKIGWINGCNYGFSGDSPTTYVYTNYPTSWGWASWRSVWQAHDQQISEWPTVRGKIQVSPSGNKSIVHRAFWRSTFDWAIRFPNWDYRIVFGFMQSNQLACTPTKNLVTNVGFGAGATHTRNTDDPLAGLEVSGLDDQLIVGPESTDTSTQVNNYIEQFAYRVNPKAVVIRQLQVRFPTTMTWLRKRLYG